MLLKYAQSKTRDKFFMHMAQTTMKPNYKNNEKSTPKAKIYSKTISSLNTVLWELNSHTNVKMLLSSIK